MLYKDILEHIKKHGEGWNELYRTRVPYNYLFDEKTSSVAFINREYNLLCERESRCFWFKVKDMDAFLKKHKRYPDEGNVWLDMGGHNEEFFRHYIYDDNKPGRSVVLKHASAIFDTLEDDFYALDIITREVPFYIKEKEGRKQKKSRYEKKTREDADDEQSAKWGILKKRYDPYGAAIADYYKTAGTTTGKLHIYEPTQKDHILDLKPFFRSRNEFTEDELKVLNSCSGRILVVGAGAGCHALYLQEKGFSVTAIDVSPYSVETMNARGVDDARLMDFWSVTEMYDTILMMKDAIGLVGKLNQLPDFFQHIDKILKEGGELVFQSTDITHLFTDSLDFIDYPTTKYFGELQFTMKYKHIISKSFSWLFIDFDTMEAEALKYNFDISLINYNGYNNQYAAYLTRHTSKVEGGSNGLTPKDCYQGPTRTSYNPEEWQ